MLNTAIQESEKTVSDKLLHLFIINLIIILVIGIIMVFSASYIYAKETFGSSTHFFIRQITFAIMGSAVAFVIGRTKFNFWAKYAVFINCFFSFLLLLTFIPGIGVNIKGAHRWINFGFIGLQPSEFVKYSVALIALVFFENYEKFDLKKRIKYISFTLLPLLLLILQPDFGSFAICFVMIGFVAFMSSFSRKYFYTLLATGFVSGVSILFMESYRVRRLFSFLDPWKNPQTSGFQIIQSYLAFANGSFFGQGIGNSNEKLYYLPEAHNDFIFSVIGEELGFISVFFIATLFATFVYLGFRLALSMKNRKCKIITASVVFLIGLQAALNMWVVLGLLPTKGLNLPFISYGGSSLIANFFGIGLIISAIRYVKNENSAISRQNDRIKNSIES